MGALAEKWAEVVGPGTIAGCSSWPSGPSWLSSSSISATTSIAPAACQATLTATGEVGGEKLKGRVVRLPVAVARSDRGNAAGR